MLYIERAKIDCRKCATKKPWSSEEISIENYFEVNIKSHVVPGKKHGGGCAKKISNFAKTNLDFNKAKVYNLIVND